MRNRSILVVGGLCLAVMTSVIVVAARVFIARFDTIEQQQTAEKADQAMRAYEADLNQLAISNRDYAEWDDAERFVHTHDQAFLDANFSYDSLQGLHVEFAWLASTDGKTLYSAQVDAARKKLTLPASAELLDALRPVIANADALRQLKSTARIISTRHGLIAFSAVEIRRSDKSAPTGCVMIFARYLNAEVLARVKETSRLAVAMTSLVNYSVTDELKPDVRKWLSGPPRVGDYHVSMLDKTQLAGYSVIYDIAHRPSALVTVSAERSIGTLGRHTTGLLMWTIGLLVTGFAVALITLLIRLQTSWAGRVAAEQRHRNILRQLEEAIVLANPVSGRLLEPNAAFMQLLGYAEQDIEYLTIRSTYVDLGDLNALCSSEDRNAVHECRIRARDGRLIDAEISVTMMTDNGERVACIVSRDLTRRKHDERQLVAKQQQLTHQVEHDALTGLPNRVYLQQRLPEMLRLAASNERSLALFYVDLDHFKNINDSRGHDSGDDLLKVVAKRLRASVAASDVVVRMGGDEFVVLANSMPDEESIAVLARRLIGAVEAPISINDASVSVTASVGVSIYPRDGLDAESLLKNADIALYQTKEKGRNGFQCFASDMNVQLSEHVLLEQALRRAIGTEELFVEYQPVVDLNTGVLVSFEALARWQHPELGLIPPGRFIPVAEKSGLIVQLGEHVLRRVIAQLQQWQLADVPLAPIAINVAPVQFERTAFSTLVHEVALQHDVDPKWLSFEITESAWMQNSNKHIVAIDTLRHAGSKIAIDDFGTGFSNLSYLKQLPVDTLKIDRAFVISIDRDESDAAIVGGVVSMARNLRLKIIAEGIETVEQLDKLRDLGCDYGQGYYFSKPIPARQCRALLEQLGAVRKFTATAKIRAFRLAS